MSGPADRRALPRFEVNADAAVMAGEPESHASEPVAVQNISLGGVCIRTENVQDVGTAVDLLVHFPDVGERLEVSGKVVWVSRTPPAEMGVRFTDLDEAQREVLRRVLQLPLVPVP